MKRVQASHLTGHGKAVLLSMLAWRAEALHPLLIEKIIGGTLLKNKKLSIRISEKNLELIHKKAEKAKLSLTEYVTKSCLGKKIIVIDGLDEIQRQLKGIGANLNRLTKLANVGIIQTESINNLAEQIAILNYNWLNLLERKN